MVKDFTDSEVYAEEHFEAAVQCGNCYLWYDAVAHEQCPNCGEDEWVGDR